MQLDRRLLFGAGLGLGLAATAAAAADTKTDAAKRAATPDLGVGPDSGRDETERLQAAIDRAAERRVALHLPAGRYIVRSLMLRNGSHITGAGTATVLQHAGGAPALRASGLKNVRIESVSVQGGFALAAGAKALIELEDVKDLMLRDVSVGTSPLDGIALTRCAGAITGCRIVNAGRAGLMSLDGEGVEISHNTLFNCADNGILVWRSAKGEDGTIVAMNRVERIGARSGGSGQNGNGVNIFRAGNVLVTSNRIADCAFSAVRANSASDVQMLANNVSRAGECALYAEFAFEGAVISGNIVNGATTGISVTNFNEGGRLAAVQGNVIRNVRGRPGDPASGYGIAVEADTAITGNTIEQAASAGILIGWGRFGRDVTATGNVVRGCPVGIGVTGDAQAGAVLVASNMISGATKGAIRALDHGTPVGPDLAVAASTAGRIRTSGNLVA